MLPCKTLLVAGNLHVIEFRIIPFESKVSEIFEQQAGSLAPFSRKIRICGQARRAKKGEGRGCTRVYVSKMFARKTFGSVRVIDMILLALF